MEKLYAPWRTEYTESLSRSKNDNIREDECVFCIMGRSTDDTKNLILKRFTNGFIALNRYPYNAGHVLVLPNQHTGHLGELTKENRADIMEATNASVATLTKALKPHGFNIGLNIGKAAGGGIPSHLHMHVLPRWNGDSNFLVTLGETKAISFDIHKMYADLKPHFDEMEF